ncbi:ATP-binding protein [Streptomyces sp. NPDC006514]|uniref:ATP-binding protein n=1 Tax=Streptomyces sp. NPDC006514 TaxID=3154308 RepID=UPI0033A46F3D
MALTMPPPRHSVSVGPSVGRGAASSLCVGAAAEGGASAALFRVPADLGSAHRARKSVVQAARRWRLLSDTAIGDLELCVGEIVANAVEHTGSTSEIRVSATASGVRVEVVDDDPQLPMSAVPDADGESGRGLLLVDALASGWGAFPVGAGKAVWFEIAADVAPAGCVGRLPQDHEAVEHRTAA